MLASARNSRLHLIYCTAADINESVVIFAETTIKGPGPRVKWKAQGLFFMTCKLLLLLLGTKVLNLSEAQIRKEINFYTQRMPIGTVVTIHVPGATLRGIELLNEHSNLLVEQDNTGKVTLKKIE